MPEMEHTLARLIDEITVDAYDTTEQLSAFLQVLQDEIGTPASAVFHLTKPLRPSREDGADKRWTDY